MNLKRRVLTLNCRILSYGADWNGKKNFPQRCACRVCPERGMNSSKGMYPIQYWHPELADAWKNHFQRHKPLEVYKPPYL
jgi:hypothetical protein